MKSLRKLETFPNSDTIVPDKKLKMLGIHMVVSSPYLFFTELLKIRF